MSKTRRSSVPKKKQHVVRKQGAHCIKHRSLRSSPVSKKNPGGNYVACSYGRVVGFLGRLRSKPVKNIIEKEGGLWGNLIAVEHLMVLVAIWGPSA